MYLEIISRTPSDPSPYPPLLFVHGASCGAWVWDEHFLGFFAQAGYDAHAFSLRGHGESWQPDSLHLTGLADYVEDLSRIVQGLRVTPVVVGHSLGGVVVQRWLMHHQAAGVVLMGSGPPHGMLPSSLAMLLRSPTLVMQLALTQAFGPRAAAPQVARKVMFSDSLPARTVMGHAARLSAESLRVGLELFFPHFPGPRPRGESEMPVLVLGAEKDFFVSPTMVEATARVYRTKAEILPDMAHAMMLESHWKLAADRILRWLRAEIGPMHP